MPWISGALSLGGAIISSGATKDAAQSQREGADAAIGETKREYDTGRKDLAPYREAGTAALSRLRQLLGLGVGGGGAISETGPNGKGFDQAGWDDAQRLWNAQDAQGNYWQRLGAAPDRNNFFTIDQGAPVAPGEEGSLLRKFAASDLESDPIYKNALDFSTAEGEKAIERRAAAGGGLDSGQTLKALARFTTGNAAALGGDAYSRYTSDQDRTFGKLSGVAGMGSGATNVGVNAGANTASNLSSLYTGLGNAQGASSIAGGNAISGALTNAGNAYSQNQLLKQLTGGGARSLPSSSLVGASAADAGGSDAWY